ncbi:MAG: hypothetical protein K1X86_12080 [Ignavibacteria bacterium]|nr:hypothetical protein [Ignavibacteria bacterium]
MESGKPSKEQLNYYYKTSRKYFDELARQYYENDREFYNQNFAQYYGYKNFNWRRKPKITLGLLLGIFGFIIGVGFASYFIMKETMPKNTYNNYNKKAVVDEKNAESTDSKKEPKLDEIDSTVISYMNNDFEKGTYFYNTGKYDIAKYYFEKVDKNDSDYYFAKDVLKAIERKKSSQKTYK